MTNSAPRRGISTRNLLRTTAALATAGAIGFGAFSLPAFAETAPLNAPTEQKTELSALPSFADLVEKVSPAVVSIRVVEEEEVGAGDGETPDLPFPPGSPFEKFFKQLQPKGPDGKPLKRKAMAQGSGFFISADGYVVTNNHVVQNGKDITVVLSDQTEMKATLVGRDQKTDLALLKVKTTKPMPYVAFGNSDKLRVGDWVLAVGNPFGLGGTVTSGIVSARGREIGAGPYDDFLQIDASINRGNSGGPTFDIHGNVVGVNTAIYSPTGGSVGIGFAIPANIANRVVAQLKEHGKVTRGWLGVSIQPVDPDLAASLSLDKPKGALVAEVTPGSPAQKAGILAGDVIVKVNAADMTDVRDVSRTVADLRPGTNAAIELWRNGKAKDVNVAIAVFPDKIETASADTNTPAPAAATQSLGLALTLGDNGVVVQSVDPSSEAAEKGIQPGDIIVKISGKDVKTPSDVVDGVSAAKKADKSSVLLLLRTQDQQRFVALTVKKA
ncbi:MAG: DegQ family serine endoprotease [Parvibaculum sp.]|uniref:DegQ family serine endoprotease n=1 Tax=Parvibaculum sp. TaxID=2024848 RepID=UPI002846DE52|nr:DegQ family serine endoprotease [Parvibaculum sp.]MDR3500356.1 DegQ family serine endoprotease [Parvibaculum sp.]